MNASADPNGDAPGSVQVQGGQNQGLFGFGGADDIHLQSSTGNNYVYGGAGNDTIVTGPGQNRIFGGSGNDTIVVGQGGDANNDRIDGGSGWDELVLEDGDSARNAFNIDANLTNVQQVSLDQNATGVNLQGQREGFRIFVEHDQDVRILAGGGNDIIRGSAGNDTLHGGAGNDVLNGGEGDDVISGSSGNDLILGGNGNDILSGGAGNDVIRGGAGNDRIMGGAGADFMAGEAGADVFVYTSVLDSPFRPDAGSDTISGFSSGEDKLLFQGMRQGQFSFLGEDDFSGTGNSEARVENGVLYVDTQGTGVADMEIALNNANTLQQGDFIWS